METGAAAMQVLWMNLDDSAGDSGWLMTPIVGS